MHYRTQGFVFKKEDINEADRFFSVYTKDFGKIEVRGKALRKINSKLRGGIDNFYFSEIEFIQGKNFKTLTDATVLEKPPLSLSKLEFFKKISELLNDFIKGEQKDKKIYDLLINTLNKPFQISYYYFFWNFFSELGYCPETSKCGKCLGNLNPYSLNFSNKIGGVICKNCAKFDGAAKKINSDIVKILRLILKKDKNVLNKLKIDYASEKLLQDISDSYYIYMKSVV